jgi:hypothetical protein
VGVRCYGGGGGGAGREKESGKRAGASSPPRGQFLGLENPGNFFRDSGIFCSNLRDFGIFSADSFRNIFLYFFSPNVFRNCFRHIRRIIFKTK